MKLFAFQDTGKEFLTGNRSAMLADQPGLGKTAQAIRAARRLWYSTGRTIKVCVICPKAATENWRREFTKWWPLHVKGTELFVVHFNPLITDTRELTTYESTIWDVIIIDEAHRLKTPGAKRTRAVYAHVRRCQKQNKDFHCWLLTGTPAKNHAGEIFTHLAVLRPDLVTDRSGRVMTVEQFEEKYCETYNDKFGHRRIRGSKNIGELRQILDQSGFFLRRMKKDVQDHLPALIFDEYPLPYAGRVVREASMPDLDGLSVDEALETLRLAQPSVAEWRHNVAQVKLPMVEEFIENELAVPGEKMIVFFHHTVLGRTLFDRMKPYEPVIVDGKTKVAQYEVDEFQNNPNCRLFLGQISACQEALNITAATQVAFAEAAWSPSDNYQAACRAHRFGMGDSLVVRFLSLAGSTDELVQRVLARKAIELAELFD